MPDSPLFPVFYSDAYDEAAELAESYVRAGRVAQVEYNTTGGFRWRVVAAPVFRVAYVAVAA